MQFSTLALSALLSLASAQTTHRVTVAQNGTLTFSPDNVKAAVGDFVQFQFAAGNHTATMSTFGQPCEPAGMTSNATGFHSGFVPAAASAAMGMTPTYSIMVNTTGAIWVYCAQAKHCNAGMVMVINEPADPAKSLVNFKAAAKNATIIVPGGTATTGGTPGTTTSEPNSTGSTTPSAGMAVSVPSSLGLLVMAAAAVLML